MKLEDYEQVFKDMKRVCIASKQCDDCPISDFCNVAPSDIKASDILVKATRLLDWAKKHPQKTRLQDFIEKHPKAKLNSREIPYVCCETLGYKEEGEECDLMDCVICWNKPVEE